MTLVFLDRLDEFNPVCWYQFPTAVAARKFAAAARRRSPGRLVSVQQLNTHEEEGELL